MFERIKQIIYALLGLTELLLGSRLVLIAIGSLQETGFPGYVYRYSQYLIGPFQGIVTPSAVGRVIVEWDTLIAMVIIAVAVFVLVNILSLLFRRGHSL